MAGFYRRQGKRLADIVGAATGLILLSPILFVVALAILMTMGRPVLFRQERIGRDSKPFLIRKFRTMSDRRGPDGRLRPDQERLTALGRFLRRTSIDELPELWNVLRGDMSMVGPRPLLAEYLPYYTASEATRHTVRPGVTGLAQVSGRNTHTWRRRLRLDTWYARHVTLWLDLRIIFATIAVVLRGSGVQKSRELIMPKLSDERAGRGAPRLGGAHAPPSRQPRSPIDDVG